MDRPLHLYALLLAFGAGWGLMQPATKVAREAGFEPWGMMAWQGVVTLAICWALVARRAGPSFPRTRAEWAFCARLAVLGTLIPHVASYTAVGHLQAGLMAILISTIPLFALPMGLVAGTETAEARRVAGLGLGLAGVVLIALSRDGVAGGDLVWIACALVAPVCYALNSTWIAKTGMAGLDPLRAFLGAAVVFAPVSIAAALATGQAKGLFAPGEALASAAVLGIAGGHTLIYAGFLWLLGRAGSVFASQTAFLVTGFGVAWSMLLLGERYPAAVGAALGLMLAGLALVRPAGQTGTR